jgi:hypothetical protein
VRARLHAIETEGAIEVADFDRQKQSEFASALRDGRSVASSLDAVDGAARATRVWFDYAQFHWRRRRRHKIELPNRAQVLAERCAGKQQVDGRRRREVSQHEPRGCARKGPQVEKLVTKKHGHKQQQPSHFVRNQRGQRNAGESGVFRHHEPAQMGSRCREVSSREKREDEQPPVMHPREHSRQVAAADLRAEQAMDDQDDGRNKEC